jgi:hypothetical protein
MALDKEEGLSELTSYIVDRFDAGASPVSIVNELANDPEERSSLAPFVNAVHAEWQNVRSKKYKKHLILGLLWMIGGGTLTLVTYNAASPGGTYFIFWGAIIWGAIDFIRGAVGWLRDGFGN